MRGNFWPCPTPVRHYRLCDGELGMQPTSHSGSNNHLTKFAARYHSTIHVLFLFPYLLARLSLGILGLISPSPYSRGSPVGAQGTGPRAQQVLDPH